MCGSIQHLGIFTKLRASYILSPSLGSLVVHLYVPLLLLMFFFFFSICMPFPRASDTHCHIMLHGGFFSPSNCSSKRPNAAVLKVIGLPAFIIFASE